MAYRAIAPFCPGVRAVFFNPCGAHFVGGGNLLFMTCRAVIFFVAVFANSLLVHLGLLRMRGLPVFRMRHCDLVAIHAGILLMAYRTNLLFSF